MPTKITTFRNNKATIREIMSKIEAAIAPIAAEYGLTIKRKGCTYTPEMLPIALQLLVRKEDSDGCTLTPEASTFQLLCLAYGFKPTDLGREFTVAGKRFRISGLKPKAVRFPILAEAVDTGKPYKFHEDTVKQALGLSSQPAFDA
jgi:hypothetical protein